MYLGMLYLILLFATVVPSSGQVGKYDHCVQSLPFFATIATDISMVQVDSVLYSRSCDNGAVRAAVEVPNYVKATYGSHKSFCQSLHKKYGESRLSIGANENVAADAFRAFETCLSVADGGFEIVPQKHMGGRIVQISVTKTSSDEESIKTVTLVGFGKCDLDGQELKNGIARVATQVKGNKSIPLVCLREPAPSAEGEIFEPAEVAISTSKGDAHFYFSSDVRLPTQSALGLKAEFEKRLQELRQAIPVSITRGDCSWQGQSRDNWTSALGNTWRCPAGKVFAGWRRGDNDDFQANCCALDYK